MEVEGKVELPRNDLRRCHEIRPITAEYGVSSESEGSVQVNIGKTSIIAMVTGPSQPRYLRHEEFDKASLEIDFRCGSRSNMELKMQYECQMDELLSNIFGTAIDLKQYPRKLILIKLYLIKDDGNVFSASIIACILALLESGMMMYHLPIPVACGIHQHEGQVLLDPNQEEENILQSLHTFIFNIHDNLQPTTDHSETVTSVENKLIGTHSIGSFTPTTMISALLLCKEVSYDVKMTVRNLMKQSSSQRSRLLNEE